MIVLVWCIAPSVNNESTVIFARLSKHIDDNVGKAKEMLSVEVSKIKTVVTEVMEKVS